MAAAALVAALVATAPGPARAQEDGARVDEPAAPPRPALTRPPELLVAPPPVYPPAALAAGREAAVVVRIHVDAAGLVTRVDIAAPVGDGFDEAARAAALAYVLRPAEWDGVPGPIVVETTIHFTLAPAAAAPPAEPAAPDPAPPAPVDLPVAPPGGVYHTTIAGGDTPDAPHHGLSGREMSSVPGTFGDPLRVVQNLPGLARAPYVLGVLLVRGTNPDDSGVYVDGHEVPILYHFLGGPSVIDPQFLGGLTLYAGGFPARFGGHLGGVVDVTTRAPVADGFHGAADVDLLDASLYLRAPLSSSVTLAVAGRRSYVDAVLPALLPAPEPGAQLSIVPVYWDAQVRADVDLPGRDTLSVLYFGSDDRLDYLQADPEATMDLRTHIGFHRVRATWTTRVGDDGRLALSLSPAYGEDVVTLSGNDYSRADVQTRVLGVRQRVHGPVAATLRLDAGVALEHRLSRYEAMVPLADDVDAAGPIDVPPELLDRTIDATTIGAHAELTWSPGLGLRVVPGVRLDAYLLAGEPRLSIDPRLLVRWQAGEALALYGYAGLYHQAPQAELFDAQLGNPDLRLEWAMHGGLGVERRFSRAISGTAEAYVATRHDQAAYVEERALRADGTVDPTRFRSEGEGRTVGLELMVRHEVTRDVFGWVSYTLSRSEQVRHPGEAVEPTAFDQTHNLVLVGSWRPARDWEVGARFRVVSGVPETAVVGGTYDVDADDYTPVFGPRRGARRPTFHQLDLRAERRWRLAGWSLSAYLDVQNVYHAENPEATQWDYRYRTSRAARGLPIMPPFGVKGTW